MAVIQNALSAGKLYGQISAGYSEHHNTTTPRHLTFRSNLRLVKVEGLLPEEMTPLIWMAGPMLLVTTPISDVLGFVS